MNDHYKKFTPLITQKAKFDISKLVVAGADLVVGRGVHPGGPDTLYLTGGRGGV